MGPRPGPALSAGGLGESQAWPFLEGTFATLGRRSGTLAWRAGKGMAVIRRSREGWAWVAQHSNPSTQEPEATVAVCEFEASLTQITRKFQVAKATQQDSKRRVWRDAGGTQTREDQGRRAEVGAWTPVGRRRQGSGPLCLRGESCELYLSRLREEAGVWRALPVGSVG